MSAVGFSKTWTWSAVVAIGIITVLHYVTHADIGNVDSHTLFRRFYYVPITTLAVVHGAKGGGFSALAVVLLYLPHALMSDSSEIFGVHMHADPAPIVEKFSEMTLYLLLGLSVGIAVDRQRHAQSELLMARKQLERFERLSALGRMVAGVAHEIRNPLASLHATAEMFLDDYDVQHKKRRMVELNFEEVKRLEGVVDRFLAFAKPGLPRRESVRLGGIVEKVKDLTESTARGKSIEIKCEFICDEFIVVDPDQVLQVVLNLVLNAIDVCPEGKSIELVVKCADHNCLIEVKDRGPGVEKSIQEQVFEPFFTTRAQGTGLGLSVASQIAQAHGGYIAYQDRAGGGAHFCVHLPRGEQAGTVVEYNESGVE